MNVRGLVCDGGAAHYICQVRNQNGDYCQLMNGHPGWHEHESEERKAKTSWNYSDPSRPVADSELWRFK